MRKAALVPLRVHVLLSTRVPLPRPWAVIGHAHACLCARAPGPGDSPSAGGGGALGGGAGRRARRPRRHAPAPALIPADVNAMLLIRTYEYCGLLYCIVLLCIQLRSIPSYTHYRY